MPCAEKTLTCNLRHLLYSVPFENNPHSYSLEMISDLRQLGFDSSIARRIKNRQLHFGFGFSWTWKQTRELAPSWSRRLIQRHTVHASGHTARACNHLWTLNVPNKTLKWVTEAYLSLFTEFVFIDATSIRIVDSNRLGFAGQLCPAKQCANVKNPLCDCQPSITPDYSDKDNISGAFDPADREGGDRCDWETHPTVPQAIPLEWDPRRYTKHFRHNSCSDTWCLAKHCTCTYVAFLHKCRCRCFSSTTKGKANTAHLLGCRWLHAHWTHHVSRRSLSSVRSRLVPICIIVVTS